MLTRTRLKAVFAKHDFAPLKRFGENYLIDGNIKDKIIAESNLSKSDIVLEIGPGLGALTVDIAVSGARIFAVEKDRKAFAILKELIGGAFPNLTLSNEDILKFDLKKISTGAKIKVIGNLPYYITTPILEYLIHNRRLIRSALVMVQREVANRLLAEPGTKAYSSVSCFVRYYTHPEYIHTVKSGSFYPSPDVDSSLIRLEMPGRPSVKVSDEALFFKIVRGSFNQRRKSLINSLSRQAVLGIPKERLSAILMGVSLDPSARPESLTLQDFANISNIISR